MTLTAAVPLIDVRTIEPSQRHATIFGVLTSLVPGAARQVASDHDPVPLHMQIDSRYPDLFDWRYVEQGPDVWRVEIRRQASTCCGGCGGN
jgi:uncharacterized protein (DUF2249 family)